MGNKRSFTKSAARNRYGTARLNTMNFSYQNPFRATLGRTFFPETAEEEITEEVTSDEGADE